MKPRILLAAAQALLVVGVLLAGCKSGIKDDPILRLSAAEALTEGKQLFERERYGRAQPYFSHAFEVEPNSAVGREALLLVADCLFLQGGTANLIQAEAKYRDFQNRFPTSERAAYVQYQIASSLSRRIERADRDQAATHKARAALEDLLRLYPTSEYAETARAELVTVTDRLAEHEFLVGRFYLRFGLPAASALRFEGLLANYPTFSERDKVLLHLGLAYRELGRADEAQSTFSKLRAEHPGSRWLKELPEEAKG